MLQIVIWMLCVYMVLKGVELWLIAAAASEPRAGTKTVATIFLVVAVLAGAFFFFLSIEQGNQMPQPSSFDPYGP